MNVCSCLNDKWSSRTLSSANISWIKINILSSFEEAHHTCVMINTCNISVRMPPHRRAANNKISENMGRKMESREEHVSPV